MTIRCREIDPREVGKVWRKAHADRHRYPRGRVPGYLRKKVGANLRTWVPLTTGGLENPPPPLISPPGARGVCRAGAPGDLGSAASRLAVCRNHPWRGRRLPPARLAPSAASSTILADGWAPGLLALYCAANETPNNPGGAGSAGGPGGRQAGGHGAGARLGRRFHTEVVAPQGGCLPPETGAGPSVE